MVCGKARQAYGTTGQGFQSGQSLTELLVMCAALVPLLAAVPILGGVLDVKYKTMEANRYALWERTVWSDQNAQFNDGENNKSDGAIREEIDTRIFGHPLQGLANKTVTENPLYRNLSGKRLLKTKMAENAIGVMVPMRAGMDTTEQAAPTNPNITQPVDDVAAQMGLGQNNFVKVAVNAPIDLGGKAGKRAVFEMKASGAILSNAWSAPAEDVFRQRVDDLVVQEDIENVVRPGRNVLGMAASGKNKAMFGEVWNADNIQVAADSQVLLQEYKK